MHNLRLRASGATHYNILAFRSIFPVEQPVTCTGGVAKHRHTLVLLLRCHVLNARIVGNEIPAMLGTCCIQQHADTCFGAFAV